MGTLPRRLVLIFSLTMLILGATSATSVAGDNGRSGQRPITDWYADPRDPIEPGFAGLSANGQNAYWVNEWSDEYWLAGGFNPYFCGMTDEAVQSVDGDIEYEGTIKEKTLPDGRALVKVKLKVENSPMTVFRSADMFAWQDSCETADPLPFPDPIAGAGPDGYWDYTLHIEMIIPEPGAVIKHWLSVLFGFLQPLPYELTGNYKFTAEGEATFTDAVAGSPEGFEPGETARIVMVSKFTPGNEKFTIEVSAIDDD